MKNGLYFLIAILFFSCKQQDESNTSNENYNSLNDQLSYELEGQAEDLTLFATINYDYDNLGQLKKLEQKNWDGNYVWDIEYTYENNRLVYSESHKPTNDIVDLKNTFTYDEIGNLIEKETRDKYGSLEDRWAYEYDDTLMVKQGQYYAGINMWSYHCLTYNEKNQLTSSIQSEEDCTDMEAQKELYFYNEDGLLIEQINFFLYSRGQDTNEVYTFEYNTTGNKIRWINESETDGMSTDWRYSYDEKNRLVEEKLIGDKGKIEHQIILTYNHEDQLIEKRVFTEPWMTNGAIQIFYEE